MRVIEIKYLQIKFLLGNQSHYHSKHGLGVIRK